MSFLHAVEVWRPQGSSLARVSAAHAAHSPFAATPTLLTRGEGFAGMAFRSGHPELFTGPALGELPLEAVLALPVFAGSSLLSVVVFFCGAQGPSGGCIEVWQPNRLRELTWCDGYYGTFGAFERLSQVMRFPAGSGIPGLTWRDGLPRVVPDLGDSSSFLRASAARELGLGPGLSLPVHRSGTVSNVVLWLSPKVLPFARAVEIWRPDAQQHLHLSQAVYAAQLDPFAEHNRCVQFAPGQGLVGKAYASALPEALTRRADHVFSGHLGAQEAALNLALALPIHDGRRVRAVVALLS